MRVLAACSLGGAGHLQPLLPLLEAAHQNGDETLVVAPPALAVMVAETGHRFAAGGEPPDQAVARIRERLPIAPAHEASVLGNRELFGRLATTAMLPAMEAIVDDWKPDLVLRDPCEYASTVVAMRRDIRMAQVAIGVAEVEWGSIDVAAAALEEHQPGLVDALRGSAYLSRFPASMDAPWFVDTRRFRIDESLSGRSITDWWHGSRAPLVYVSFGTVLGHMTVAAGVYATVLEAVRELDRGYCSPSGAASTRRASTRFRATSTSRPGSTKPTSSPRPSSSCATGGRGRRTARSRPVCHWSWSRCSPTSSPTQNTSPRREPASWSTPADRPTVADSPRAWATLPT